MSVGNIMAVREDMPAALVTQIMNVTWGSRADWALVHSAARDFKIEGQKTAAAGIAWHPAAEAFWKGQGASL